MGRCEMIVIAMRKAKAIKQQDVKGVIENLERSKGRSGRASWRW